MRCRLLVVCSFRERKDAAPEWRSGLQVCASTTNVEPSNGAYMYSTYSSVS